MTQKLTFQQQRLCEEYLPLAMSIASRMARTNPYLDRDDAISDAMLGLIDASTRFDRAKSGFGSFAVHKIQGAVQDGARRRSTLGDRYRRMAGWINKAKYAFAAREHRFPTDSELAQEARISIQQLLRCRQGVVASRTLHFDYTTPDSEERLELADMVPDPQDPYEATDNGGDWGVLDKLLDRLPGRERFVLAMFFWKQMTPKEIGGLIGVTDSRILQIKTAALKKLREWAPVELQEQLV